MWYVNHNIDSFAQFKNEKLFHAKMSRLGPPHAFKHSAYFTVTVTQVWFAHFDRLLPIREF